MVMNIFKNIHTVLRKVLAFCSIILFATLVIIVSWQVISRQILNSPSAVTEELAKIVFVWLVLFAAAYLFGERGGHMNVAIIPELLSGRKKWMLQLLCDIIVLIFAVFVLCYGGYIAADKSMGQVNSAITAISIGQIYTALPICGISTVIYSLIFIAYDIQLIFNPEAKDLEV